MPTDPIVAYTEFVHAPMRPVFEQPAGRQDVLDDDGEHVFGVWYIPRDEADDPILVEG